MFKGIEFANAYFLYLLVIIPLVIVWYWFKHRKRSATILISSIKGLENAGKTYRNYLPHILFGLRCITIGLLIIILARPQSESRRKDVTIEGIDIVMALDISGSMMAADFKPNRLEASKDVAKSFIDGRPGDRIGLVVFSGESFTQCPLTSDHSVLKNLFKSLKTGMIEDGTAIGNGLATAVSRIKDSKAVSKVVILLTDGVNNMGDLDPISAAEIAEVFGIRIYTIGVGKRGMAPYPFKNFFGQTVYQDVKVEIDEELLKEIASMSGGKYFRATNKKKLKDIYSEIDKMEKSKIDVTEFRKKHEEFLPFALIAGLLFIMEILGRYLLLRNLP